MDTDLDFTFDDIYLPSDTEDFLNSLPFPSDNPSDLDSLLFSHDLDDISATDLPDFLILPNDPASSGDSVSPFSYVSKDVMSSPASDPEDPALSHNSGNSVTHISYVSNNVMSSPVSDPEVPSRVSDYPSPGPATSRGSGNSVSAGSYVSNDLRDRVVDQKMKVEEELDKPGSKRKKGDESSDLSELRTSKYRKGEEELSGDRRVPRKANSVEESVDGNLGEDDKRMARLMRNRESAQLSRQRKKHYVEELEDKVRAMHSTIQDLNTKITYVMAENASLRQQAAGAPPPGMYPHPPMGYPWVSCAPYLVKPQGSQVPLVPIPRLKPQQPASAPKARKSESKRSESKTKKVASVSLLGLLFFMLLFGGLMPMVNLKFREMNQSVSGRLDFLNNRVFYHQRQGGVLTSVNGSNRDIGIGNDFVSKGHCGKGPKSEGEKGGGNSSEPLVASLYVPRNDKLVKIDGNLIIHSVMASEKAMASSRDRGVRRNEETGLAVARNNMPSIIPLTGRNRHPHPYRGPAERQRAISGEKDKMMSPTADGKLQQWFREGLAGPMLSSGMCTEVFQFDISPAAGAIVPAPVVNVSSETQHPKNITTKLIKGRNRRNLHGDHVPLVVSKSNVTQKPVGIDPEKDNFRGNSSLSSMVVSVLVDPREAGDGDGDGVMGPKSISRIFVVVLIDSVNDNLMTYEENRELMGKLDV